MRALVTGGAGFIGSHLVDRLVADGHKVAILDNFSTGHNEPPRGVETLIWDVREAKRAISIFKSDVVFHLAAQTKVTASLEDPVDDAETNVLGTIEVLEGVRDLDSRLIFASTGGAIYGECFAPALETMWANPKSPYGMSKWVAEEYLGLFNRLRGTSHTILRLANVYGPRQRPDNEGGVVAIFLARMLAGEEIVVFGDGEQTRDFVYVDDVVDALLAACFNDDPLILNIGTGVATSINDLTEACAVVAESVSLVSSESERPGEIRNSVLNPSLAKETIGWEAKTSLEEGLLLTAQSLGTA